MRIVIVGAGFTGTQLTIEALRRASPGSEVVLVERSGRFGPGLAYSTTHAKHLLNVRASNMSAFESDPSHFLRWLWANDLPEHPAAFVPPSGHAFVARGIYGLYLAETLQEAERHAAPEVRLERLPCAADALAEFSAGVTVRLDDGTTLCADVAVIATGNHQPAWPAADSLGAVPQERMIADPWDRSRLAQIGPDESILVLGTGLTMIDIVAGFSAHGHRGPIRAISRRGLLPQVHEATRSWPPFLKPSNGPATIASYVRRVRAEVRTAAAAEINWRSVIDALRPYTQELWRQLPEAERRRFLRHVRPWWEIHRHRMAPQIADLVQQRRAADTLTVEAGRILRWCAAPGGVAAEIRLKGASERIVRREAAYVINGSGPCLDHRLVRDPLIRGLLDSGLARRDRLALGLDVTTDLALVRRDGGASRRVFALGPPTRGEFWEITAVPDIRKQNRAFAERIFGPVRDAATARAGAR